jgi:ubiquinone/menaquinone biosynthesis C-methylase UbiE
MSKNKKFIPALGYDQLTAFYDKVIQWTMPENMFRTKLISYLSAQPDEKIMEFGFGTGQNIIYAVRSENKAKYFGLDIDPKVTSFAEAKLQKLQFLKNVQLDLYDGESLPYSENSFDKVFSCLVFHQLNTPEKKEALKEIYRVLKPKGMVLICDWGKPSNFFCSMGFFWVQCLDGFKTTADNRRGLLPDFLKEAGFSNVTPIAFVNTKIGTLRYITGTK